MARMALRKVMSGYLTFCMFVLTLDMIRREVFDLDLVSTLRL